LSVVQDNLWALQRWEIDEVELVVALSGAAAVQSFDERAPEYRRAVAIGQVLSAAGVAFSIQPEYRRGMAAGARDMVEFRQVVRPGPEPGDDEGAPR
jgi:hypothetical protein